MPSENVLSKIRKAVGRKSADRRRPQTESSSSTPTSITGPRPRTPSASKPDLRERPPTTAAAPKSDPCIAQPPPDSSGAPRLPGRLWTQAYDAVKEANPKLVHAYETLLRRVPGESDPAHNHEVEDQANAELTRSHMVQLIQAGLEKTKRETERKEKAGEVVRVIASVRDLVGAALKHAPEAAAAWGGVCLLLNVSYEPLGEAYVV